MQAEFSTQAMELPDFESLGNSEFAPDDELVSGDDDEWDEDDEWQDA